MKKKNVTSASSSTATMGRPAKFSADDWRALIRLNDGDVPRMAAAAGHSRHGVYHALRRHGLLGMAQQARRGAAGRVDAAADAMRAALGARLTNGDADSVRQWLALLGALRVAGAPVTEPFEAGVALALRRGDVTPDEVVAAYGPAGAEAAWAALHGVVVDELRAALAARADDGAMLTDFCGVLHRAGVDVAALLPAHLRRRGGRPAFKQVKP